MILNLPWCRATTTLPASLLLRVVWSSSIVFLLLTTVTQRHFVVHAWYQCPEERGGGVCPDGATCCATSTPGISSCITEKEEEYVGVCCTDDGGAKGVTGCDHNYNCAASPTTTSSSSSSTTSKASTPQSPNDKEKDDIKSNDDDDDITDTNNSNKTVSNNKNNNDNNDNFQYDQTKIVIQNETVSLPQFYCQRIDHPDDMNIPERLPRYRLCSVPRKELTHLFGFTVKPCAPRLAYYSSLNALDATDSHTRARHANVKLAWIFIHGSKRNADDYHCCALATLPKQEQDLDSTSILVLSPRFLDRSDEPAKVRFRNDAKCTNSTTTASTSTHPDCSTEPLYFAKHGPIAHTWRYGADAVNAPISSYKAIDAMVEALAFDTGRFPNLERIVVAGHSAGGQYVHRWALTSMSPAWGDANEFDTNPSDANDTTTTSAEKSPPRIIPIHAVAANPRSFCYLDERRFDIINQSSFSIPDESRIHNCPGYNKWEWGLEPGGPVVAHYKDRALKKIGTDKMAARYAKRKVTYLAGDLDVLPLWSECEDDDFQGPNRRTRSELFHKSLEQVIGQEHVHNRVVVPMIHHDHCLLFQSEQGREVLFGKGVELESQY